MTLLTIVFPIVACVLNFLAGLSTKSKPRQWFHGGFVVVLILFGIVILYGTNSDTNFDFLVSYTYFLAFGMVIPRLIAHIINGNRLEGPVLFIKRKSKPLAWALAFFFWAYFTVMVFQPNKMRDGMPIYDEQYFRTLVAFLILLIPSLIYMLIVMLDRTAFCKNGLFHAGLRTDWSEFTSYSWPQSEIYADPNVQAFVSKNNVVDLILEANNIFSVKQFRIGISLDEKSRIENLLSRKIKVEQTSTNHAFPKPA